MVSRIYFPFLLLTEGLCLDPGCRRKKLERFVSTLPRYSCVRFCCRGEGPRVVCTVSCTGLLFA